MSAVLASKHQGKDVKMPTIKDIARIAGVSHGTVSNVLNGRGNVSVEKIEAVQRAAREVGYQLNAQAQSLRASKSQGVALILPDIMWNVTINFIGDYTRPGNLHSANRLIFT